MNQPTGFQTLMPNCASNTAGTLASITMLEMLFILIPSERGRLRKTLGHEPTYDDLIDCCQFIGERMLEQRCLQRASDREKIRRFVFGEVQSYPTLNKK